MTPKHTPADDLKKLERSFEAARAKFIDFLDDPIRVDIYNKHMDTLIEQGKKNEPIYDYYKITPEKSEDFKKFNFTTNITNDPDAGFTAAISRDLNAEKKLEYGIDSLETPVDEQHYIIQFSDDTLEDKNKDSLLRTMGHEMMHAYMAQDKRKANLEYTENLDDDISNIYHISHSLTHKYLEEFACDTAAHCAHISARSLENEYEIRGQKILVEHKHDLQESIQGIASGDPKVLRSLYLDTYNAEDLLSLQTALTSRLNNITPYSVTADTAGKNKHPSPAARVANVQAINTELADLRSRAYLEDLYGVPINSAESAYQGFLNEKKYIAPQFEGKKPEVPLRIFTTNGDSIAHQTSDTAAPPLFNFPPEHSYARQLGKFSKQSGN